MSFFNALGQLPEFDFGKTPGGSHQLKFGGIEIIASEYLPKTRHQQFRFPRSKKKRIRKKWAKRLANWRETDATRDVYVIGNKLHLIHPDGFKELKKQFGVIRNVGTDGTVGKERKG